MAAYSLVDSEFARSLIRRRARVVCRRPSDRDDLAQDLFLRLIRAQRRFDDRRSSAELFLFVVVERGIVQAVREYKRRHERIPIDPAAVPEDISTPRDDPIAIDLALDVAAVLAQLPAPLRAAAEQLKIHTKSASARNLRISRNTLNTRARDLRKAFERYRIRHS